MIANVDRNTYIHYAKNDVPVVVKVVRYRDLQGYVDAGDTTLITLKRSSEILSELPKDLITDVAHGIDHYRWRSRYGLYGSRVVVATTIYYKSPLKQEQTIIFQDITTL